MLAARAAFGIGVREFGAGKRFRKLNPGQGSPGRIRRARDRHLPQGVRHDGSRRPWLDLDLRRSGSRGADQLASFHLKRLLNGATGTRIALD